MKEADCVYCGKHLQLNNLPWRCTVFYPQFFNPFFPFWNLLWRHKNISFKDTRDVMKRIWFQAKIADALTTLLSRYSNWTKPTTAATTHSNKMIVLSQLIVHGIQWAYDQTVRAVKIHSKDFNNFFLQNLKFAVVERFETDAIFPLFSSVLQHRTFRLMIASVLWGKVPV